MADDISVKRIQEYRNTYTELRTLTDQEILSIIDNAAAEINPNEDEQISMFGLQERLYSGLELERGEQKSNIEEKASATKENSDRLGTTAMIGGAGILLATLLSQGKIKSGFKSLQKFSSAGKSAKIYTRPSKIKFETIAGKVNNNQELKDNPICKHLLKSVQRDSFSNKDKKIYLTMLDMVAENKILSSNKNLMYLCERGTFYPNSKSSLKFLEDYVNNPVLHNNKHISASLGDITEMLKYKHNEKHIKSVIDKFIKNDKTVMSDLLKTSPGMPNHLHEYYAFLPESIVGKDLAELNPNELKAVKKWFYYNRADVPNSNLLRGFYPSIPSYAEDFPVFVKGIKKLESVNSAPLNPNKLQEFNKTLFSLAETNEAEKITSLIPELFPAGRSVSKDSIELLKKISKTEGFQNLSTEDKRILIMSTILQDTGGDTKTIVSCYQRLGFKTVDSEKIVNITKYSNMAEDFIATTKKPISYQVHRGEIVTNARHEFFDNAAFDLKEENTFELAQMLYSSKCQKGLTRNLDKMLSKKINEFKAGDFMMPQTPRELYISKAQPMTIVRRGKSYNVRVVKRSEIGEFYAYCHTPINVSARKDASIIQNISKLELQASETMSDRIICTCFVDSKSNCFVSNIYNKGFAEGFIGQIPNSKQYVGAGADLGSLAKDKRCLIQHYYNDNGIYIDYASLRLEGTYMPDVRKITANNLKKELNISDSEYIKRMDKIKKALGDEPLSIEKLQTIDPEMAAAYKNFLSRRIGEGSSTTEAVLRTDQDWNEFLCSEFKIADIYTTDVNHLSPDFLEMAANPKNDMVIISMFE